jgi:phage terminase Nu1 subunit (DNA packaging protein)
MAELLNQKQFAETIGVAKSYITKLKQEGRLIMVDGKVDVDASIQRINDTRDPNRDDVVARHQQEREAKQQRPETPTDNISSNFATARAIKMGFEAKTAKLEYEKATGKLIETEEVRAVAANAGATLRSHLERMPDQLAPELSVENNQDRIHALLVEHIEYALQQVTKAMTNGINEAIHAN